MTYTIKSSSNLHDALKDLIERPKDLDLMYDIAIYKFYNYYLNTHIKAGSDEDKKNEKHFHNFEVFYPELNADIERMIDNKIDLLNGDIDD